MNHCKEKTDLIELILRHAEGRPNTAHSTSHSQQGRQQTQAGPINPQSQSNWQPRSSTVYPPPNTQPVQVCAFNVYLWPLLHTLSVFQSTILD